MGMRQYQECIFLDKNSERVFVSPAAAGLRSLNLVLAWLALCARTVWTLALPAQG